MDPLTSPGGAKKDFKRDLAMFEMSLFLGAQKIVPDQHIFGGLLALEY